MTPERLEEIRKTYYDPNDSNAEWRVPVGQHVNNAEELLEEVDRLRGIATIVVASRAKFLRAKEEESHRSLPSVRRVDDARKELGDAIDALREALEEKP